MAESNVTTTYVQQEHGPGGWEDHAETTDREVALARYKSFAESRGRPTRLIERTERVLAESAAKRRKR